MRCCKIGTAITAAASLTCSVILLVLQTINNARAKRAEERDEQQKRESRLSLKMVMANNKLSYAVAMAVKRGKPNGEVEEAVQAFLDAKKEYEDFLREVAADALH